MPTLRVAGATVSYSKVGAGPAVLLIQGVGVVGNGWRPQIDVLSRHFTCISFDNRGIGASPIGDGALSIETMAGDAIAITDAEGIDRFHVVGHSMGGSIAQEVALQAPTRVRTLSLLCTFARGRDATALSWPMVVMGLRTRIGSRAMRRRAFLELIMPGTEMSAAEIERRAGQLAPLFGHDLADQPPIVMTQLRALGKYDASSRLASLASIPTLVMSAERDLIARPVSGRALAAAIPGSTYVELDGAGHGVPIQYPERVNQLLSVQFEKA